MGLHTPPFLTSIRVFWLYLGSEVFECVIDSVFTQPRVAERPRF